MLYVSLFQQKKKMTKLGILLISLHDQDTENEV